MSEWKDRAGRPLRTTSLFIGYDFPLEGKNQENFYSSYGGGAYLKFLGTFVDQTGDRIVVLQVGPGPALTGPEGAHYNIGKELPARLCYGFALFTVLDVVHGNCLMIADGYDGNHLTWQHRDGV